MIFEIGNENEALLAGTPTPDNKYMVAGQITQEGAAANMRQVRALKTSTLEIHASTLTDSDGNFSMSGFPHPGEKLLIIAQDATETYNAKAIDHVEPVELT